MYQHVVGCKYAVTVYTPRGVTFSGAQDVVRIRIGKYLWAKLARPDKARVYHTGKHM